ncbi:hypothetical protein BH18ACI1_BH18ACI1_13340 [soil metagenome]
MVKTSERDYKSTEKRKFQTAVIASDSSKKLANVEIRLPKLNFNFDRTYAVKLKKDENYDNL